MWLTARGPPLQTPGDERTVWGGTELEYGASRHIGVYPNRPPSATMMERQIASPIPSPLVFVV